MPVQVKCQWCGKESISAIRKGKTAKYCSRQCYWKAWEGDHPELYKLPNRICEECGKEFHPRDKNHGKRFCSRECLLAWRARQRKVKCIVCGKEFLRDNANEKFCSQECWHTYNVGSQQATFNNWLTTDKRGYTRFTVGHPKHTGEYLHNVIWREVYPDGVCQICGKPIEAVHHIDDNKSNNDIKNLIGLCNSCHHKIHQPKGIKIGTK